MMHYAFKREPLVISIEHLHTEEPNLGTHFPSMLKDSASSELYTKICRKLRNLASSFFTFEMASFLSLLKLSISARSLLFVPVSSI